jgi:phosphohistidine swiveling domain-containing protein
MPADHDAVTTWLPDPSHYPEQMTPLSATVWFEALGRGLHEAMRELRAPFGGFATRTELGWAYELELDPEWDPDPDALPAAALDLPERWERELLPRVRAITEELEGLQPERPPPAEAEALLDRLWALVQEQWKLHFLVVIPAQIAAELLHERYVAEFDDADPLAAYRLLEGIPNPADEAVRELASAAREAGVAPLIVEHAPADAMLRLAATGAGRRWRHQLDEYLLRYGGRSRWHELSLPREAELPMLTLESVRLRLQRPDVALAVGFPTPPPQLSDLVGRVRRAYALKELHTYEIDYPGLLATREALLAFGRRLVAEGVLPDVEAVWLLRRDDLRRALTDATGLAELVDMRRRELAQGLEAGPQPFLGDPPANAGRHPALEKFYGRGGSDLSGAAASPGIAEGEARVVVGPGDFGRVRAGDVLVTTTTTPAWTPLFPSLAALVTETGGILSHAAVVAREYRIPSVVGVAGATRAIADGAWIRVDGSRGTVERL